MERMKMKIETEYDSELAKEIDRCMKNRESIKLFLFTFSIENVTTTFPQEKVVAELIEVFD